MLILKAIYRKNLKMSTGKIAAQVAHATMGLGIVDPTCTIRVLAVSDKKFREMVEEHKDGCYVCHDAGYTEVEPGTQTAAAWIEQDG